MLPCAVAGGDEMLADSTGWSAAEALMSLTSTAKPTSENITVVTQVDKNVSELTQGCQREQPSTSGLASAGLGVASTKWMHANTWTEPIKVSASTVYGTQHAMLATGGFRHSNEEPSTPRITPIAGSAAGASCTNAGALLAPASSRVRPVACSLKWVTHGSSPKHLLGDGRYRGQGQEDGPRKSIDKKKRSKAAKVSMQPHVFTPPEMGTLKRIVWAYDKSTVVPHWDATKRVPRALQPWMMTQGAPPALVTSSPPSSHTASASGSGDEDDETRSEASSREGASTVAATERCAA